MSDRTEGRNSGDDAFDLGESSVEVRKAPPDRSLGRIVAAGVPVALGLFFFAFLVVILGRAFTWPGIGLGSLCCGLGFAIYDYRWPFGPRPGRRGGSRRPVSRREDDY